MKRFRMGLLVIAGVGIVAALFMVWYDQLDLLRSYLLAFVFWTGLAVGSTGMLMLQFVTGGRWGVVLRHALTAAGATMPLMAVLCIPILFGISELYPWHDRALMIIDPTLSKKASYLSPIFFIVRSVAYFVVFTAGSLLMLRWQRLYFSTSNEKYLRRLERFSSPGMFLLGVFLSLALIDWVMSLEPRWYSTIYALIWITGNLLAALAFSAAVAILAGERSLGDKEKKDIGNLLLAFIMLWAYCSFSQYLLIWSGNLRDEIPWYLARVHGVWGAIALTLVVLHFALPFLLLLSRSLKRSRSWLLGTCVFLLVMRFIDAMWLIDPAFGSEGLWPLIGADIFWMIVMGAMWGSVFLWIYASRTRYLEAYA